MGGKKNIYRMLNQIGISILLIGLINIYNIVKEGAIFNIPTTIIEEIKKIEGKEILKIDINSIKILIFITLIIFIIFSMESKIFKPKVLSKDTIQSINNPILNINKRETVEYELLVGLGLIGLIIITISKELITLYLGLELYSFSLYVLILVKESITIRKISIIYLILSSLASGILLYSFNYIYNNYGVLDLEVLTIILNTSIFNHWSYTQSGENIILFLILLAFLFKLGSIPFSFWLIRLYADLDKRILWYQLTIPKLIFFILLIKFLNIFYDSINNQYLINILFILSILSIILGGIGGLFQTKDNLLLSYSSILNIGFVLLALSLLLFNDYNFNSNGLSTLQSMNIDLKEILKGLESNSKLWVIYQFFTVYIINLVGLFSSLFLYFNSSLVFNFRSFFSHPFFFSSFLIIIFSFIGLPPFSGFFSKFFLLFTLFTYSYFSFLSFSFFIIFSLISSFFYFKFLFSSSSSPILFNHSSILTSKGITRTNELKINSLASIILAMTTLFTISYPFFLSYLIPFFYLSF